MKKLFIMFILSFCVLQSAAFAKKHVLIYTKNGEGYVHDNIDANVEAIKKICDTHNITYEVTADPAIFTPDKVKTFDAQIWANTNNEAFDTKEQKMIFQKYMQNGGAWMGIHAACASERDWDWFAAMVGGRFVRHPKQQDFDIKVLDNSHPSTRHLPEVWEWKDDECYYLDHFNPDINVILAVDLTTVEDDKRKEYPDKVFGDLFPIAWHHEFDGGRQFYTSLGHKIEHYVDPQFVKHLEGGLLWLLKK